VDVRLRQLVWVVFSQLLGGVGVLDCRRQSVTGCAVCFRLGDSEELGCDLHVNLLDFFSMALGF